ncbi:FkbM family methyltransferase [Marinicella rhabdoformis]|uniref:FkbM family methyltransferase n=1 Tax=Marinicella rhabdoformis TaxID=2580566 RepID=UPI0012AED0F7|nr:FkbM family methyltransferase [Marinicella rhabdoformis]
MLAANGLFPIQRLKTESNRNENIKTIRSLVHTSYQGHNQCVCRVLGQFLMFVNTLDERLGIQLQMNGFWEMNITEYIARHVEPGMTALDVGANYGYYSMLMASLVGPHGEVHSLEANPNLSKLVIKSSKINGFENKINVINKGVSDVAGESIDFAYSDDTPMNGLLADNVSVQAQKRHYPNLIQVETDSIDNLLSHVNQIDFIKIDIEGSEDRFWYGSKKTREKNPNLKILMEFNRARYNNVEHFINQIFDEGYQVIKLSHKESLYEPIDKDYLLNSSTSQHLMLAITKTDT